MKGKTLSLMGILAAAVGVAIILFFKTVKMRFVVECGGVLFILSGLANMMIFGQSASNESSLGRVLNQIGNTAAIILGVCMLVFNGTFEPLVSYMFGLLILVSALWQFFVLAIGIRPHQLPGWNYIFPVLLLGGAVYIYMNVKGPEQVIMLATGVSLCVMGLGCLIEGATLGVVKRRAVKAASGAEAVPETVPEALPEDKTEEKTGTEEPKTAKNE